MSTARISAATSSAAPSTTSTPSKAIPRAATSKPISKPICITMVSNLGAAGQSSIIFRMLYPNSVDIPTYETAGVQSHEVPDFIHYRNYRSPPSSTATRTVAASSTSYLSFLGNLLSPPFNGTSTFSPNNHPIKVPLIMNDVSGQDCYQFFTPVFARDSDGVVFVVNAACQDRDWNLRTKEVLHRLLYEENMENKHLLIFASKMDRMDTKTVSEVKDMLGLDEFEIKAQKSRNRKREDPNSCWDMYPHWTLIGCSAKTGEGIQEGMDWLVAHALERREQLGLKKPRHRFTLFSKLI
ncbi:ADP-ribosylation factor-like protein 2 [Gryganskiella cystojenkinii]|nr:ADP-ribosylation factor-like protein 2 [Gryganskiella cystojenkinii]